MKKRSESSIESVHPLLNQAPNEGVRNIVGGVLSPLLSNVFLHYVLDLWVHQWRKRHARGRVVIVRYADDFVMGFQYEADARKMMGNLCERLAVFGLMLHDEKTRLLEFGRLSTERRERRGDRRPETFAFLG